MRTLTSLLQGRERSIFSKTLTLTWGLLLVVLALLETSNFLYNRKVLHNSLDSASKVVATSLSQVINSALVTEDYSNIISHCMRVVQERPLVAYIVVVRNNELALVHKQSGWGRQDYADWMKSPKLPSSGFYKNTELVPEEVYNYSMPATYLGVHWGWIHVGISLKTYNAELRFLYARSVLVLLVIAVLGFVFSYGFAKRLTGPVVSLNESVRRLQKGDFSVRAVVSTNDEVAELAHSFNAMAQTLEVSQKRLLDSNKRFAAVAETSGELVWETDGHWRITYASDVSNKLLGCPPDKLKGRLLGDILKDGGNNQFFRAFEALAQGASGLKNFETACCGKKGAELIVEISAIAVFGDNGREVVGYRGVLRDITERARMLSDIKRRSAILETISLTAALFLKASHWKGCMGAIFEKAAATLNCNSLFIMVGSGSEGEEVLGHYALSEGGWSGRSGDQLSRDLFESW
ncbi:MAG TPA: HAMP domain-containing protein, partial [Elusimicrobiales bacterium]|nr:HAMP domain-containing protein [Elusimicrobiales bacterium]